MQVVAEEEVSSGRLVNTDLVELHLVVEVVVLVPVVGLVAEAEAEVPLVLFVVLFFSHLLVAVAEEVEVLGIDQQVVDMMLITGLHIMEELLTPIVVALVVTVLATVAAVAAEVVGQVDLLVADTPDLITPMAVAVEAEETPTIELT